METRSPKFNIIDLTKIIKPELLPIFLNQMSKVKIMLESVVQNPGKKALTDDTVNIITKILKRIKNIENGKIPTNPLDYKKYCKYFKKLKDDPSLPEETRTILATTHTMLVEYSPYKTPFKAFSGAFSKFKLFPGKKNEDEWPELQTEFEKIFLEGKEEEIGVGKDEDEELQQAIMLSLQKNYR